MPQEGLVQGGVLQRCELGDRAREMPNLRAFDRPQSDCNPGYPRRVGEEEEERHRYQNPYERPGQPPRSQGRGRELAVYGEEEEYSVVRGCSMWLLPRLDS